MSDRFTKHFVQLNVETEEMGAVFSPDGTRVLTAVDRTVSLWDAQTGDALCEFEGHTGPVGALAWSRDQHQVLSGAHNAVIRLWDVNAGRCLRGFEGHRSYVRSVEFSADGRRALSGSGDGTMRLCFHAGYSRVFALEVISAE